MRICYWTNQLPAGVFEYASGSYGASIVAIGTHTYRRCKSVWRLPDPGDSLGPPGRIQAERWQYMTPFKQALTIVAAALLITLSAYSVLGWLEPYRIISLLLAGAVVFGPVWLAVKKDHNKK